MGKLSDAAAVSTASSVTTKTPTSEQLRIAQLLVDPKSDDHSIKDKVSKVMELTRCNESTALVALHDCDNDVEQAVDKLLEGDHQGEWIVQEGKKSKKVQHQHQPPHYQQSYDHRSAKENHHGADLEATGGNNFDDENSMSAPYQSRGPSRGGGHGGDFPPRFRGRGGSAVRPGRRFDKENEPFEFGGGADRGRGRGRGRGGGFGGERGRGRGFAPRGGRRGGFGGNGGRDGGFDQQMGSWDSGEVESNTWDNSMANSCGTRGDGGSRRTDDWKGADDNNTWDNSMAQTAAPAAAKKPQPQRSNEWNNNSADDWGGEEDWSKGLVIESSGVNKQHTNSAVPPPASSAHATGSSYASAANAGHVRGESINVNMLFTNQLPETQSSNASQSMWSSKQATADLKNELGIGKIAPPPLGSSAAPMRQMDPPVKPNAAKVELPSIGSRNAVGPIDVQFGDMTLLSDSQPLFAFDAPGVFKSQTNVPSSQQQDPLAHRQGQMDPSAAAYQRTQKNDHVNGPDLLLGAGEGGAKGVDVSSATYSMGGGYTAATQAQQEQQFGSSGTAIRQMASAPTIKNANSGLSSLSNSHQRALLTGNGGANVSGQVDSAVQQLSKDVNLNQGGILNAGSSAHGSTSTANYLSSAPSASRSPASIVTSKPQVSSTLNVNPAIAPYQQAMAAAGISPYLNMYDQMSLNSVGFLPPQNLFLNAAGGFDMRALTQLPPLAGNTVATGRDNSGDMKAQYMRQDTGSNLAATGTGLANLSVPPPGLPAPTVSNAEQAAQILSMAGMYPTFPLINTAPPFLAPQFLVPNVSATSTVTTGSQYQRTSGYPQAPIFNAAGYEDIQLPSQDYGKNNYNALSANNQTKTVSSGAGGMAMGVNDANKGYAGGLKGYDAKSFVPATATPPSLGNMSFPTPFQTTAATGAYGYPNYMPPVNMSMMASPMALASNVQLSNDMLGGGAMNQRGGSQNSKAASSNVGKAGQYPFPSWGN